jgi:hypothetical protein
MLKQPSQASSTNGLQDVLHQLLVQRREQPKEETKLMAPQPLPTEQSSQMNQILQLI